MIMAKRDEIDCCFLDLVKHICQIGGFGSGGEEMRETAERMKTAVNRITMQRDLPWLTDVFFLGILAGEDVQAAARASLLAQWGKLVEVGQLPAQESEKSVAGPSEHCGELTDAASVRMADCAVRLMSRTSRPSEASRLKMSLKTFMKSADADAASLARCWIGKHGPLPLADYRDWTEAQLDVLCERMCAEGEALSRAESAPVDNKDEFAAEVLRKRASALSEARSRPAVMRLTWLPEGGRELLATSVECLDHLHKLVYFVTYGLDRYGAGAIPALRVAGRRARDGGVVGVAENEYGNANMVLDNLAMGAYLKLMDVRERNGRRVACFGPLRKHVQGPLTSDYLIGMVQNAVANLRGHELLGGKGARISKIHIDEPRKGKDGEEGHALMDTLPSSAKTADDEKDRSAFFKSVIGSLAPNLLRYYSLVNSGVSKGEARKRVGAKSAHFVEREINAIVKELAELQGEDFAELSRMLREVSEN